MALPADVSLATFTGVVRSAVDGSAVDTLVTITPSWSQIRDLPGGASSTDTGSVLIDPPTITLDTSVTHEGDGTAWSYDTPGDGTFSVKLIGFAPDLIEPQRFTYSVVVKKKSDEQIVTSFSNEFPAGSTVDLSLVATSNTKPSAGKPSATINIVGGGGSGVSDLSELSDVDVDGASDGNALVWDETSSTWIPGTVATGDVSSANITDAGATGVSLIKADDDTTARTALGATAVGAAVFTAASQTAARSAIGAGTSSVSSIDDLTGVTATGKALATAASAAAARTTLGASTVGAAVLVASDEADARDQIGAASAAQGALASTAVQPDDIDDVVREARTINGKALSSDVTLSPSDVTAVPAPDGGVRLRESGTVFPTTDVQVGDIFVYYGEV